MEIFLNENINEIFRINLHYIGRIKHTEVKFRGSFPGC